MLNVILLASTQPRVGKSTLTKALLKEIPNSASLSFAVPIKHICYNLYKDILSNFDQNPEYTLEDYKQLKKDVPMEGVFNTSPRHQYCEGSNFISSLTSDEIWGKLAVHNIKKLAETGINTVIIDDWRRLLELRTLVEENDFNCITVYLDKDGIEVYEGTAATESFEGQISKEDCSLFFKFNNDWSNSNEIVNILKETVTG